MHIDATSDAPDRCPECGDNWTAIECVHTGDPAGVDGYEDWCFCMTCGRELFYPLQPAKAAG